MSTSEKIQTYLVDKYMPGKSLSDLDLEESLLESGLLDSAGIFDVVSFLEESFQIQIEDEEIVANNFNSVSQIAKLVESKVG